MKLVLLCLFSAAALSDVCAQQPPVITKQKAMAIAGKELAKARQSYRNEAIATWSQKAVTFGPYLMPFDYRIFGERPADGRSLYISLHGGGNTAPAVNTQQWQNQLSLYSPREGIYLAPRAATDTWDLWHQSHIDPMLSILIKTAIVMEGVNPDKVYIMGYSAGGDGVFRLATRMADHWATAAVMAGHPGEVTALNLRNLPFSIYMGGLDGAYQRNTLARLWNSRLDSLGRLDPGGYAHEVRVFEDMPHWMNRKDTIALEFMAAHRRVALPGKVVWLQDRVLHDRFYWLGTPLSGMKAGTEAMAEIKGNTITILKNTHPSLYIYLNDTLLNLDKPVTIVEKGHVVFKGMILRSEDIIRDTAGQELDASMVFYARAILKNGKISFQHK